MPVRKQFFRSGFTLIELLIVVAIIAILAAIAVPNFLEAQTRSKVSRAKADMRSIATSLEAYAVDNNQYPYKHGPLPPGISNIGSIVGSWVPSALSLDGCSITTPIAYMTAVPEDVFNRGNKKLAAAGLQPGHPIYGFRYCRVVSRPAAGIPANSMAGNGGSDISGTDPFGLSTRADRYGRWFMLSSGPDLDDDIFGFNNQYDPTNGTISNGDILYSQKNGFNGDRI
ncbi:prepilin-type N-terminal cleavage/methylation domain-containing protein [Candidatus Sumerlaeota bacterium]|nr:prepilin-type N-terminal cleavage/methylation domain-containing protein [Candidatus Sumerlaeota bacterium]